VAGIDHIRLMDIVAALNEVQAVVRRNNLRTYVEDRPAQMIVERGLEIVSEASRSLSHDLKARYPDIPWQAIKAFGNVLRHEYQRIDQEVIWKTANLRAPELMAVCKAELEREQIAERQVDVQTKGSILDDDIRQAEPQVGDDGTPENSPDNTRQRKR